MTTTDDGETAAPVVHRAGSAPITIAVQEYSPRPQPRSTGTTGTTGTDAVGAEGKHGQPGAGAPVVFLPALGVPLTYYRPLLERWSARGRRVFAVELRGMPLSPVPDPRRDTFGYSEMVRIDLPAVFALPAVAAAGEPVLVGHSLGGHLTLLSTAAGTVHPRAVVTIATGTSSAASQRTWSGRLRRRAQVTTVRVLANLLGRWPGDRLGFGGRQPKRMILDWAYEGRHGRYRLGGDPADYEGALATLPVPALLLGLDGDWMVPPLAVTHLRERLAPGAEQVTLGPLPAPGFDHFLWARRSPDLIIDEIETWLRRREL